MMTNFHVGQKFSSFSEFEQHLLCFEDENFVKFHKRDSRKIESAVQSRRTNVKLNPDLIYYEIRYNCVRGGAFRVQGTGKRKRSSCKIECSAHISLRAAVDGKSLEVKSFDNTHNHEKIPKTWIEVKRAVKNRVVGIKASTNVTGGGTGPILLPLFQEKIKRLIDPVLTIGDENRFENGQIEEIPAVSLGDGGTNSSQKHSLTLDDHEDYDEIVIDDSQVPTDVSHFEVPYSLNTPTSSSLKTSDFPHMTTLNSMQSKKRKIQQPKVKGKDFADLVDAEGQKTSALNRLAAALEQQNVLKEREICVQEKRNEIFSLAITKIIEIANAFQAEQKVK